VLSWAYGVLINPSHPSFYKGRRDISPFDKPTKVAYLVPQSWCVIPLCKRGIKGDLGFSDSTTGVRRDYERIKNLPPSRKRH